MANEMWEARLRQRYAAAPLVEIIAAPHRGGAGGDPNGSFYLLSGEFIAWRIADGPVQRSTLSFVRALPKAEVEEWMRKISFPQDSAVRISARFLADDGSGKPEAYLEQVLNRRDPDAELNGLIAQLRAPIVLNDPTFGMLRFDRLANAYAGETVWNGATVSLDLETPPQQDMFATPDAAPALLTARAVCSALADWDRQARERAVTEILPIKNHSWLEPNEQPWTAARFLAEMRLHRLNFDHKAEIEATYLVGEMFCDHCIRARGNLAEGWTSIGLE